MQREPIHSISADKASDRPGPRAVRAQVLVIDDDRSMCELLEIGLRKRGFDVLWRTQPLAALHLISEEHIEAIVVDLNMPGLKGTDLCQRIVANRPDLPVIVITAFGSMETAIASIRAGAYDFLTKPFEVDALAMALTRAVQHRALREEVKLLRRAIAPTQHFGEMVGTSLSMQRVYDLVGRVAETDVAVLIMGESGTGKELVARAIHHKSARRDKPFVAVNCSALPEALLESELFGHRKGAFTDARAARKGLFQQADGGTLFLDEIGELPLGMQPKLLRVLQERQVRPVGGDSEAAVDVRILAATHRDLEAAVAEHAFREDLYFRINAVQVNLPPLRSRGGDVLLLAQHMLERCAARMSKRVVSISPKAAERLLGYNWLGNVRELQNCIERAVALATHEQLSLDDLPERIRTHPKEPAGLGRADASELVSLEEIERRYILHVLDILASNKALAAQVLGMDRRTLYRKLDRYGPKPGPCAR